MKGIHVLFAVVASMLLILPAYADDAPSFELEDLNGDEYSLEDLLDECNLLVIDFWQVGCKPCNQLLPHLQEFYDEFQEEGVEFVIVSRDTALTLAQVEPFFVAHKYTFRVLLDTELTMSKDYHVKASPATFIITPEGEMLLQHYGYKPGQEKEIREIVEAYLAGEDIEPVFAEED
jgi:peroxiredoxin